MKNAMIVVLLICAVGFAASLPARQSAGQVEVTGEAWVRSTPPNRSITAGYLDLRNTGTETRRLISVSSPVAGRVELHTHVHDRSTGMMQMRHVESIEIPAGERVQLAPGGQHIMLMDLDRDLQAGVTVPMTLNFDDGSELSVEAVVRHAGQASEPAHDRGHGHNHGHGHGDSHRH